MLNKIIDFFFVMKANLIIDENIYVMDCPIKTVGAGLFWHIPTSKEFEKLLKGHHIVFTTIKSRYYTGNVSVYRSPKPNEITICLDDLDTEKCVKKHTRLVMLSALIMLMLLYSCIFLLEYLYRS